jgi:radical SAM protein with 4Fe4S-binding SPASM domain
MQIYILLTNNCNLSCSHCIRSDKSDTTLSKQEIETILSNVNLPDNHIVLTGGEPSLHPDFTYVIDKISKSAKKVTICTNGINNYYFESIKDSNIHLQFSIDGNRQYHNKIRGLDSFDKIIKNIQLAQKYNISHSISTVVNKINVDSISEMLNELKEVVKSGYIRFNTQMDFGNSSKEDILSIKEWNSFVDSVQNIEFPIQIRANKLFDFESVEKLSCDELSTLSKNAVKNCGTCTHKVYIYPDLNVYSCTCLDSFPIGNLKENSLNEILLSEASKIFVDYLPKLEETCMECRYLELCNGGCVGTAFHKYKEFGHGDPRCPKINKK